MISQIKNNFDNNGFFLFKKFYSKKEILFIKKKILKIISDKNNYLPIKDISKYHKESKLLRSSNGKLKINLNESQVSKGLKYIGKKANSISIKEPLLKVKEINKFIFDKKMITIAKKKFLVQIISS